MVGSCNGLVCTDSGICNPTTGEFLCGSDGKPIFEGSLGLGFGYHPSTNEYKVVRIRASITQPHGYVEVYTLGSQSGWRRKEHICYMHYYMRGIFVNGAIHWMVKIAEEGSSQQCKIVAFDLADESIKSVSTPPLCNHFTWSNGELMLMRGNLCFIHRRRGDKILDIWTFKKNTRVTQPTVKDGDYYGNNWSWIKEFSIAIRLPEMSYMPLEITESNEVLLWQPDRLCCYNANTSTITKSWDGCSMPYSCLRVIPHMNTLVSLKDLGEFSGPMVID